LREANGRHVEQSGALALTEPLANAAALHAFDRWWAQATRETRECDHAGSVTLW